MGGEEFSVRRSARVYVFNNLLSVKQVRYFLHIVRKSTQPTQRQRQGAEYSPVHTQPIIHNFRPFEKITTIYISNKHKNTVLCSL